MKALVIYDSVFGNTEKVALAIGAAIGGEHGASTLPVSQVSPEQLSGLGLLVVGSPTRGFRPTEAISKFLIALPNKHLAGR